MKITIESQAFSTTPEQDAALQRESDLAMVGRGNDPQPPLDEFTKGLFLSQVDGILAAQVAELRGSLAKKIAEADPKKLTAIEALIDAAVAAEVVPVVP
jgi:hypothetical protein